MNWAEIKCALAVTVTTINYQCINALHCSRDDELSDEVRHVWRVRLHALIAQKQVIEDYLEHLELRPTEDYDYSWD